jgi:hypothetical protein
MLDVLKFSLSSLILIQLPTNQSSFYIYFGVINVIFGIVNVTKAIYDWNKDRVNISIQIKRDSDSLAAIQQPLNDYLLIEVVNKGHKQVVINEVGIMALDKNCINIVDMPWVFPLLKGHIEDLMGSIEWVAIPGTINPGAVGKAQLFFFKLEEVFEDIRKEKLLIEEPGHLQKLKFLTLYQELMNSYNSITQVLTVTPYILTTTGQRFIGKPTNIQLGNLNIAMQTTIQKEDNLLIQVRSFIKSKVWTSY